MHVAKQIVVYLIHEIIQTDDIRPTLPVTYAQTGTASTIEKQPM